MMQLSPTLHPPTMATALSPTTVRLYCKLTISDTQICQWRQTVYWSGKLMANTTLAVKSKNVILIWSDDCPNHTAVSVKLASYVSLWCCKLVVSNTMHSLLGSLTSVYTYMYCVWLFAKQVTNQDDSSARGCFTWGPAKYNNTIDIHDHKTSTQNIIQWYIWHMRIR